MESIRAPERIGIETGDASAFSSYEQLVAAFRKQLHYFVDIKLRGNPVIERLYADYMPAPFLSLLVDDCIAKGKDYNDGGPRYNTTYIMGVAPATCTDSLAAIKYHVFDRKTLSMEELTAGVGSRLRRTRKIASVAVGPNAKVRKPVTTMRMQSWPTYSTRFSRRSMGGEIQRAEIIVNIVSTTCHVYFGSMTGATPDGRRAWEPLSDGVSHR